MMLGLVFNVSRLVVWCNMCVSCGGVIVVVVVVVVDIVIFVVRYMVSMLRLVVMVSGFVIFVCFSSSFWCG